MKILSANLVKHEISSLIEQSREVLYIISPTFKLTNAELFQFVQCIEHDVKIYLISKKPLTQEILGKLAKLYNIRAGSLAAVNSRMYLNESSAIITSCPFGRLKVSSQMDCGIYFEKREHLKEFTMVLNKQKSWWQNLS